MCVGSEKRVRNTQRGAHWVAGDRLICNDIHWDQRTAPEEAGSAGG